METQSVECDVLVIGTGASGMAAASTAASRGLNGLMIEKGPLRRHDNAARVSAFLRHGPEAVDFFTSRAALQQRERAETVSSHDQ
jgi:flavin-dependent dehydrogenase